MHLLLNSTFYVCFPFLSEYDVIKSRLEIIGLLLIIYHSKFVCEFVFVIQ